MVRLLRARTDLSQDAIARMTGLSQGMVSQMESGQRSLRSAAKKQQALEGLGASEPLFERQDEPSGTPKENRGSKLPIDSRSVAGHLLKRGIHQGSVGENEALETLALAFTDGVLADSLTTVRRLWRIDLDDDSMIHRIPVAADEISTPMLRWLLAPPAVLETTSETATAVGLEHVAAVRRACQLFETLDHEFGGGHARKAAVQYLHSEVSPLLRGRYTEAVGRQLFAATAHFSYKVGAMGYDAGLHGLGRRYFVQALNLAHLAADRALAGKALALLSHQANFLGEFRQAVDFARTAKMGTRGHVTPRVHAMYSAMEARALASLGQQRECAAALKEMEEAFQRSDPDQEPDWLGYFDEAEVNDELAHCFHDLGQARPAAHHAQATVELTRREFRRSRTFASLILAGSHLIEGSGHHDVEQACVIADQAIRDAGALRSQRVATYVRRFDGRLGPYADTDAVRAFRERFHRQLSSTSNSGTGSPPAGC